MANLTKRDLVTRISEETGVIQQVVSDIVQRTLEHIVASLAENRDVELRNFGVFEVRLTRQRVGRNPKQPEVDFVIPPRATVKFKPGKVMRQRVSQLSAELRRNDDGNGDGKGNGSTKSKRRVIDGIIEDVIGNGVHDGDGKDGHSR